MKQVKKKRAKKLTYSQIVEGIKGLNEKELLDVMQVTEIEFKSRKTGKLLRVL